MLIIPSLTIADRSPSLYDETVQIYSLVTNFNVMKQRIIGMILPLTAAALFVPAFASAAGVLDTIVVVNRIVKAIVPLLISVALIVFIWGLIKYLTKVGDEGERAKAIQLMLWGIVAIFVMSSVWGLVALLQNTFSVQRNEPFVPRAPDISVYGR